MLYLFGVVFGLGVGSIVAPVSPLTAQAFGLRSHGVILGTACFGGTVGGLISPVLVGHIFDITGSYQLAFVVCLVVSVAGIISIWLLKPTAGRD